MLGYGLAGICRRWLVWPAAMIWPSDLVNCALMYTWVLCCFLLWDRVGNGCADEGGKGVVRILEGGNADRCFRLHDHSAPDPEKTDGWKISRYRWFLYVLIGMSPHLLFSLDTKIEQS